MDSELEVIRIEMEATRDSLAHKIGELETQVRDTVAEAGNAVSATKEGVMDVVSSVSETVDSVKESIKETFDIRKHIEDYPWAAFGVAVAIGATGAFLMRASKATPDFAPPSPAPPPFAPTYAASAAKAEPGILSSVFSKLQVMAIASLVDVVQDLVRQSAPEPWKDGLRDIVNDISAKLTDDKN